MDNTLKISNLIIIRVDEVVHWVIKRIIWIVLAGVILAAAGGAYATTKTSVPMYRTTTKLYVTGVQTAVPSANSFALGRQVIANYVELMESRPVLEEVIETLDLNMSISQLASCISQKVPSDTCILEVTVIFPDPQWAKAVADEIIIVSAEYALEIMGCNPPTIYEEATVPTAPYNTTSAPIMKYAAIGGVAGVALAGMFVLFTYFVNNKFTTPGKTEDKLNKPVWAVLPKEERFRQVAGEVLVSRLSYEAEGAKIFSILRNSKQENSYDVMKLMAKVLTDVDKNVICVDTNLGNPEWSTMLPEAPGQKGLYDYLVKGEVLEQVIIKGTDSPDKIVCGNKAINAGELLKSNKFTDLIEQLRNQYDYVFVDVAPLQTDVTALAATKATEAALWVVSAKSTKTGQAKLMKKQLETEGVKVDGIVLTDFSVKKGGKFFKKKYGNYIGLFKK